MTFNEKMLKEYFPIYKKHYQEINGEKPTSWWSFIKWLAQVCPAAYSFNSEEITLAKELMKEE